MEDSRKTLKGLAERLDLSIATVSRALAGHEQIALETRHRVAEAAREYGYVPNVAARMLVSGRSGFVGLVMPIHGPTIVDSYFGEFITGLGEGLTEHGQDLFLATVPQGQPELPVLRHVVESGRADGIILTRIAEADERVAFLTRRNFPFVAHGRLRDSDLRYHWHDVDSGRAFAQAFDLLYDLGHRHFGLVTISEAMTFRYLRESGLHDAAVRRGDPDIRIDTVSAPRFDRGAMVHAINQMLTAPVRPTAIIGLFDEIALTVMEEAARAGISIPQELSVIGYDNIKAGAYSRPGLTTFDASIRNAAREMADMLMMVIATRPKEPLTRLIEPEFVARASHGLAPAIS